MTIGDPFALGKYAVGFEDIFSKLASLDNLPKLPSYPPYNVRKTGENTYVIEMAVAGFGRQDLEITLNNDVLTITGAVNSEEADYIYKGIADRAFTRKFTLADTVEVKNADLVNGMLKVWLERFVPEEKKPTKIEINGAPLDSKAQAEQKTSSTAQFLTEKNGGK